MSRPTSSSSSSSTSQISLGAPGNSSYLQPSTPRSSREAPGCLPPPNTPKSVNISSSPSDREDLSSSNQSASLSIELSFSSQRSAPRDSGAVAIELDTPGNSGYLPPTGIIPPPNTPQRQEMGEMPIELNINLPPLAMSFTPSAVPEMRRIINRAGEMEIGIDVAPQQPAVAPLGASGNSTVLPIPQKSGVIQEIHPIQITHLPIQKTQTISPGDPGNSCFLPPTDPPPPPAPLPPQQKESKPEVKSPVKALEELQKKIAESTKKSPAKPEETKKSPAKIEKSSKVVEGGNTPEESKKKPSKIEQLAKTPETKKNPAKGGAEAGKDKTKQPDAAAAAQQKKEALKSKTPPPKISEKPPHKGKKE